MAKRIRNFIDRAFSRTVDLKMLHRLLSPYLEQIGLDWDTLPTCSIPDDHIDPRRSAFFMARSVLRDIRSGVRAC